jgi:hypothetical protein
MLNQIFTWFSQGTAGFAGARSTLQAAGRGESPLTHHEQPIVQHYPEFHPICCISPAGRQVGQPPTSTEALRTPTMLAVPGPQFAGITTIVIRR